MLCGVPMFTVLLVPASNYLGARPVVKERTRASNGGIACPRVQNSGGHNFRKQMTDPLQLWKKFVWKCNVFCYVFLDLKKKEVFYEEIQVSTIFAVKRRKETWLVILLYFFPLFREDTKEKTRPRRL